MYMSNISLYRIATLQTPFILRPAARFTKWVRLLVSYLQYLMLRHELFAEQTGLRARMTPQVCYLERMLQMHISPNAVINPTAEDVIMWRDDEPAGLHVFIDDSEGRIFFTESEFGLAEFTVLLPLSVATLTGYSRELLDAYKLPGTTYTILLR